MEACCQHPKMHPPAGRQRTTIWTTSADRGGITRSSKCSGNWKLRRLFQRFAACDCDVTRNSGDAGFQSRSNACIHVTCYEGDEKKQNSARHREAAQVVERNRRHAGGSHIHFLNKDNFLGNGARPAPAARAPKFSSVPHPPTKPAAFPSVIKDDDHARHGILEQRLHPIQPHDANGVLTPLPAQHVDTGMGFERICTRFCRRIRMTIMRSICGSQFFKKISEVTGGKKYDWKIPQDERQA